ncbi:hypothetical protein, partial [Hafnia paralvei]|uniref:hypothetical protein n=1 Tax=Hafnia paralvei TaxID=546367 RepID=UPI001F357B90
KWSENLRCLPFHPFPLSVYPESSCVMNDLSVTCTSVMICILCVALLSPTLGHLFVIALREV